MPWAVIPPLPSDYNLSPTRLSHKGDDDDDYDNDFRCVSINSEKRLSTSSCMSLVCPLHTYISVAPTERMVVKFDAGKFYENL